MLKVVVALLTAMLVPAAAQVGGAQTTAEHRGTERVDLPISTLTDSTGKAGFLDLRFVRVVIRGDGAHVRMGTYDKWGYRALKKGCAYLEMTWPDNDRRVTVSNSREWGPISYLVTTLAGDHILRFRVSHAQRHQVRFVLPNSAMGSLDGASWSAAAISPSRPRHCSADTYRDLAPERGYVRP